MNPSNDSQLGHAGYINSSEQSSSSSSSSSSSVAASSSAPARTANSPPLTSTSRSVPAQHDQFEPRSPSSPMSASVSLSTGNGSDSSSMSETASAATVPVSRTDSILSTPDEEEVLIAIKCPSLDRDSTLMKFPSSVTVLHVKQKIQRTWPGAPNAHGMRCIRAGRLLQDGDLLRDMAATLQPNEPLSLHLVIRPDAWSDPQNRPTSSRRSSYARQQTARASLLQNQATKSSHDILAGLATDATAATSGLQFAPYFSDPVQVSQAQLLNDVGQLHLGTEVTDHDESETCSRLEQTIRVTAPENYPVLTDALTRAYDEYLIQYEDIYSASFREQEVGEQPAAEIPVAPRDVLDLVEGPLFGWSPIELTSNHSEANDALPADAVSHYYRQITHKGLPYLLRLTSSPHALQRSEALSQLLVRMSALRTMLRKIENLVLLGSLIQQPSPDPTPSSTSPSNTIQHNSQQRTRTDYLRVMLGTTRAGFDQITIQDLAEVAVHVFFLVFRVSILLYIVVRHADPLKKFFVLGMSAVYVAFESWRILLRRIRARQPRSAPQVNRPATPIPPPVNRHADGGAAAADAPAGSNVPHTSQEEEDADRQVTQEPLRPLPSPRSPPRNRAASTLTLDFLLEYTSFIGLDMEDAQLGLLPATDPAATRPHPIPQGLWPIVYRSAVLPVLLFFFTMVPEVEQRRKRAIEERERVIRKWTRLEEERRQNARDHQPGNESTNVGQTLTNTESASAIDSDELLRRRKTYADQILRRRTGGMVGNMSAAAAAAAADTVDAEDDEAIQRALGGQDDDEMELDFF